MPPGYDQHHRHRRYPTVYWTHGFGGRIDGARRLGAILFQRALEGRMPPMIWVMLDEAGPTGTHEFADSVNNGPWGRALTNRVHPRARAQNIGWTHARRRAAFCRPLLGRLGDSSTPGELSADLRGALNPHPPDPSDFHDFSSIDLYADHANIYRRARWHSLFRSCAITRLFSATLEQFARN